MEMISGIWYKTMELRWVQSGIKGVLQLQQKSVKRDGGERWDVIPIIDPTGQ